MAHTRQTRSGRYELKITNKLLPKALYFTFDSEAEAQAYGLEADRLLNAGVIPAGFINEVAASPVADTRLSVLILQWRNTSGLSKTDDAILGWLLNDNHITGTSLSGLTYTWAEAWVTDLKLVRNLAPSSIRQRVQALSKVLDWYIRSHPTTKSMNPLRLLPRGYSIYSDNDAKRLALEGGEVRRDVVRDRRLHPGEADLIRSVLRGERREGKQRPLALPDGDAMLVLFELIIHTGCRLREAYTLARKDVNTLARMLRVKTTKQRNGNIAYRDVPIRPELFFILRDYMGGNASEGLLFPFWDGSWDEDSLRKTTSKLSARFATAFELAPCDSLCEHDLRHEATCQWFELKDDAGQWMFRPEEINKIMGWTPGSVMAARYAAFRGADLAQRLWAGKQV